MDVLKIKLPELLQEVQLLLGHLLESVYTGGPLQVLRNCGSLKLEGVHSGPCAVEDIELGLCRGVSPEVCYYVPSVAVLSSFSSRWFWLQ